MNKLYVVHYDYVPRRQIINQQFHYTCCSTPLNDTVGLCANNTENSENGKFTCWLNPG